MPSDPVQPPVYCIVRSFQDCKASLPKEGPDAEAGSTYSSFKVCLPRSCFSCLHSVDFSKAPSVRILWNCHGTNRWPWLHEQISGITSLGKCCKPLQSLFMYQGRPSHVERQSPKCTMESNDLHNRKLASKPRQVQEPNLRRCKHIWIVLPVWLHACKVSRVPAIFPGLSAVVASTWNFIGWTPCEHSHYLLWTGGQQLPMGHFLVQSDENGSSPGRVILAEAVWWLVSFFLWLVWNMNGLISPIVGMMIQSDELIFFRGVGIPPTSLGLSKYLVTSEKRRLRAMILGDGEKIHDRDFNYWRLPLIGLVLIESVNTHY